MFGVLLVSSSREPMWAEEGVRQETIECVFMFKCQCGIEVERGAMKKTLKVLDSV